MAQVCGKCDKDIVKKDFLLCILSRKYYHLDCTSLSENFFYLMSVEGKKRYKCDECRHRINVSPKASSSFSSPQENITFGRQKVNILTENSFDALSPEEDDSSSQSFMSSSNLKSVRSCPDLNINTFEKFEEMERKMLELKEKFNIAENEIINLLEENKCLKKEIKEYNMQFIN